MWRRGRGWGFKGWVGYRGVRISSSRACRGTQDVRVMRIEEGRTLGMSHHANCCGVI